MKTIQQRNLAILEDGTMPEVLVFLQDGAQILSTHVMDEKVFIHVLLDDTGPGAHRKFIGFSVCEEIPPVPMTFIGQVVLKKGKKILHIFELLPNPRTASADQPSVNAT